MAPIFENESPFDFRPGFCLLLLVLIAVLILPSGTLAGQLKHQSQADVLQFLEDYQPDVVSADKKITLHALGRELKAKRLVFVGERHNRYDHHLNQLAVLRLLHQQNPNLAIGVEWFQQSFQSVIDAYLAGKLSDAEMLEQSGYYARWGYDYRLLKPVMVYAREHQLPVIALNAPAEITRKVSADGLESLSAAERKQIPAVIHPPQEKYHQYLRAVFDEHMGGQGDFDRFVLIQRIWDETMAANIVKQLKGHPQQRMLVFAGSGHVGKGTAIPADVARELPAIALTTLHSVAPDEVEAGAFDYFILSEELTLPPTGRLGVWLEDNEVGEPYVAVRKLAEKSAAGDAGMLAGDRFVSLDGKPVASTADVLSLLATTRRGQEVEVVFMRADEGRSEGSGVPLKKAIKLQ